MKSRDFARKGVKNSLWWCDWIANREDSPYLDSFHFKDDYTSNKELNC